MVLKEIIDSPFAIPLLTFSAFQEDTAIRAQLESSDSILEKIVFKLMIIGCVPPYIYMNRTLGLE